jgi:hypothetical protein
MTWQWRGCLKSAGVVTTILGSTLLPGSATAQTVRGTVYDETRSTPAIGAIVTLERVRSALAAPEQIRSVLTDESGAYSINATEVGNYRVLVRRIGSKPYRSDVFQIGASETRRLDVHLERFKATTSEFTELGRITVMRVTPCETSPTDAVRIARLWDDARTALLATEISIRDSLVPRRLVRFVRDLNPETLEIQSEVLYDFSAPAGARPGFTSPPGDSLSLVGYWRRVNKSNFRFYGPDANALLSQPFVEDHCFSIAADDDRPGQIGLSFEPVEYRRGSPPEIRGTVWLDSLTSELRSLEFNWLKFPIRGPTEKLGGEVRFMRLPAGSWLVHRWRLRMPQEVMVSDSKGRLQVARTRRFGIVEEGGFVDSPSLRDGERPATITGTVRDGDGKLLAGARVDISGTSLNATTDFRGHYLIDSVPPGVRMVVVEHPQYEALGVRAGESKVLLDEGTVRDVSFDGPTAEAVSGMLCGGEAERGKVTLRLTVLDSATIRPMQGLRLSLVEGDGSPDGDAYVRELEADTNGVVVFCNAPANRLLILTARIGKISARVELKLPRGLTNQVVRWPGPGSIKL